MRAFGNESRLMILCTLAEGERSVGELNEIIPLSQSALSQQLARLRRDGLVGQRYDWRVWYQTGPDGTLTRYHVPPGVVRVSASRSGYRSTGQGTEVRVDAGRLARVTVTLEASRPPPAPPGSPDTGPTTVGGSSSPTRGT